ncbi:L,D-transpeptidase family protein [Benzoatithermus flavus]|uniref:L,D-transpeptidase family protein n=1 Tax=Benzoatithermus flavus TaxID=3108223 RepID=A0ABU8XTX7_9PROT
MISRRLFGLHVLGALGAALFLPHAKAATATVSAPQRRTGDLVGEITYYVTHANETLLDIARAHNLGVPEISAVNPGVDPWVPGEETLLILPTAFILPDAPREGIVINYGDLRLYYFPKNGPVQTYALGIGRDGFELKYGQTRIVRKKEKPTWYLTESEKRDHPELGNAVPPGPDNPLGEYALYLGWPTYLIHGTNKPYGVGRRVSRGCFRMYPEGVARLFREVQVGTKVTVLDQRVKVGWHQGELYIEVQPDIYQIDELEATQTMTPRPPEGDVRQHILNKAGADAARIDWSIVDNELLLRRGIPVQITRPELPVVSEREPSLPMADAASSITADNDPLDGLRARVAPPAIVRPGADRSGFY